MKGLISLYMLIILVLATIIVLNSFETIFQGLSQVKYYIYNQREVEQSNQDYVKKLLSLSPSNLERRHCIEGRQESLCYLINGFSSNNILNLLERKTKTQTKLLNYNYYQQYSRECDQEIEARTQNDWRFIHPRTCLRIKTIDNQENYYNYNLALENLRFNNQTIIIVNGYFVANQVIAIGNVVILAIGAVLIDDLLLSENSHLTLISLKDSIHVRHLPENAIFINKNHSTWQVGLNSSFPKIEIKFLSAMAERIMSNDLLAQLN